MTASVQSALRPGRGEGLGYVRVKKDVTSNDNDIPQKGECHDIIVSSMVSLLRIDYLTAIQVQLSRRLRNKGGKRG